MNASRYNNPTPPWIETYSFDSYKDTTNEKYINIYPTKVMQLVEFFQNYPSGLLMTFSQFSANPVPNATVSLTQTDFNNGTVRLRHAAHYVLSENIIFEPNPNDNWMPTSAQTAGGATAEYPIAPYGGYHLGFFAAITLEAPDIFLDLNGKTLRQSVLFSVQQRFYANIELASSPFIPSQGPGSFGDTIVSASKSLIANGSLGHSSHHGIHGNGMSEIIIQNLTIHEFEVAGIAMNGGSNCLIRNVQICNMSNDITVLSTYSSARFMQTILAQIVSDQPGASLAFVSGTKTGQGILDNLSQAMAVVVQATQNGTDIPDNSIFKNSSGIYDGGGYGIVLNSRGVVVNGFKPNRAGAIGNDNIVVHDVKIDNFSVGQGEIIGVSLDSTPPQGDAYGGKEQVGVAGDVLQIKVISDNGAYVGNVLSDAKLFVAKFATTPSQKGTINITQTIIDWALSGQSNLETILNDNDLYFVSGGDSMGHVMKGLIGLFISAGKDIQAFNMSVKNLSNSNLPGKASQAKTATTAAIIPLAEEFNGAAVRGVTVTGSENVLLRNIKVNDLRSECGTTCGFDFLHTNTGIVARDSLEVVNIRAASVRATGKPPNPQPSRPIFFGVSATTQGLIK